MTRRNSRNVNLFVESKKKFPSELLSNLLGTSLVTGKSTIVESCKLNCPKSVKLIKLIHHKVLKSLNVNERFSYSLKKSSISNKK